MLDNPGGVGLPLVLVLHVYPVLDRLYRLAVEADCHNITSQPLRLQLLQVFQQRAQILSLPRGELVGPPREWDGSASRPGEDTDTRLSR
jgi:hypothetical protein